MMDWQLVASYPIVNSKDIFFTVYAILTFLNAIGLNEKKLIVPKYLRIAQLQMKSEEDDYTARMLRLNIQ